MSTQSEIDRLPPRAFGSIMDMLKALRGAEGMAQSDLQTAAVLLQHIDPALSERIRQISIAQQAAIAKAEGR